jgi:hypothetical protein
VHAPTSTSPSPPLEQRQYKSCYPRDTHDYTTILECQNVLRLQQLSRCLETRDNHCGVPISGYVNSHSWQHWHTFLYPKDLPFYGAILITPCFQCQKPWQTSVHPKDSPERAPIPIYENAHFQQPESKLRSPKEDHSFDTILELPSFHLQRHTHRRRYRLSNRWHATILPHPYECQKLCPKNSHDHISPKGNHSPMPIEGNACDHIELPHEP